MLVVMCRMNSIKFALIYPIVFNTMQENTPTTILNEVPPMSQEELDELIAEKQEKQAIDKKIHIAEEIVQETRNRLGVTSNEQNPRYRDIVDALVHHEETVELLELLDSLEDDAVKIRDFIQELFEEGPEFEKLHPDRAKLVKEYLYAHRAIRKLIARERMQKSG